MVCSPVHRGLIMNAGSVLDIFVPTLIGGSRVLIAGGRRSMDGNCSHELSRFGLMITSWAVSEDPPLIRSNRVLPGRSQDRIMSATKDRAKKLRTQPSEYSQNSVDQNSELRNQTIENSNSEYSGLAKQRIRGSDTLRVRLCGECTALRIIATLQYGTPQAFLLFTCNTQMLMIDKLFRTTSPLLNLPILP